MEQYIKEFFTEVSNNKIEIYNEFSLQHELGIFLRSKFQNNKIQFERNVSYFGFDKTKLEKKEIDISVFNTQDDLTLVIKLKYPRNGQVPESLFSFCKDISFLEQLKQQGFPKAYFLAVVDDKVFYSGRETGIYRYFRSNIPLTGKITKPTGIKDKTLDIKGLYTIKWHTLINEMRYCLIEII